MIFPFVFLLAVLLVVASKSVVELQSLNFELTITSYQYVAILFYDTSDYGLQQMTTWVESASLVDSICDDCEIAMVNILIAYQTHIVLSC